MMKQRFEAMHRDEGGAMVLLALAACLMILLSALVIFDAGETASNNVHVQHSTDAAAFSQASIQARSMNMVAYTNVGKRMTVGMVNTYININQWLSNIDMMATYLAVAVCAASVVVPPLASICSQVAQAAAGAASLVSYERRDRGRIYSKSRKCMIRLPVVGCVKRWPTRTEWGAPDYWWLPPPINSLISLPLPSDIYTWRSRSLTSRFYARELKAFDNYQRYMIAITPFWAWTEGVARGIYNRAPVTVGYPPPPFDTRQRHASNLPVRRGNWSDTCERVRTGEDRTWHAADIALKSGIAIAEGRNRGSGTMKASRIMAMTVATLFSTMVDSKHIVRPADAILARTWWENCMGRGRRGGNSAALRVWRSAGADTVGKPFILESVSSPAQWQLRTSTLMFGFRPNASMMDDAKRRKNYSVMGPDYRARSPRAGGIWKLARSEFAFQKNERPNLWEPRWTARMRPVALPGEWNALRGFDLANAFNDSAGTLAYVTAVTHAFDALAGTELIDHPHSLGGTDAFSQMLDEVIAIELAVQGLNSARIEGLAK
ncbi:hypothetical protein DL240_16510 [Lujinxingia litoralis]|uniref:Uncharacterized protein n=1 Tax=Lujinxingia litoralis TaxID=2211119 RepID=A0A328C5Q4_9DELT|nr:hypothetical protein [Lujinxingia litoralis]RAL20633.1 hypothetical protein DL240_16510 [Lujinxingia litoralis]